MSEKPTYEELEQRVRELEKAESERKQAEKALQESEQKFRSIFENLPMGIHMYQLDPDGQLRFIGANPAANEILGVDNTQYLGKTIYEAFPEIHKTEIPGRFKIIAEKGGFWKKEEIVYKDEKIEGAFENFNFQTSPGKMVSLFLETTERKQAEKALRESEEVYRTLVESANSIILKWDINGHIIYLNPYGLEYFKYVNEEVVGKHVIGTIVPENETTGRDLREMMDNITKNPLKYKNNVNQNIRSDGELVWVAWTNEAILDESGKFVEILSIGNDITERKQAEKALRESEERFRTVADFTYDWESWIDPDGNYIYVSPSCERITGYSPKEFLKSPGLLESITHPDDRKKISVHLHDHLKRDDEVLNIDFRIISRSGNTRWISHICQPVYDSDGNWAGRRASNRDITEQREVEAQLQRAEKMEAMGTLAGRVAHDLNNVLSGIVSYPDLLLMDLPEDSPLRKPILTMKNSGEKAVDIVQDLLTMARRGDVVTDLVNLNDIISEYLKSAEHERLISYHPGVEVKTKLEADLLNLSGSPVHLSKIVMNLVSNAAEAISHGGKIFISTENRYVDRSFSRYDSIKEGDYVVFAVSDTGVGISSQDIEKIFEPFYTKKVMGRSGTGLGMAVVWGTVKDHNGYIDVQSNEGKGTTFTLYFPATREKIAKEKARLSNEDYMGKEESILVVDDIKEQRELALALLATLGYAVDTVSSGEEAVEYLKEHTVDLIVLDMIMDPGIDGLETFKNVIEVHPGQKAIIASGFSETDRVKKPQRLGAGQ